MGKEMGKGTRWGRVVLRVWAVFLILELEFMEDTYYTLGCSFERHCILWRLERRGRFMLSLSIRNAQFR
jgi:hypothetical protein